MLCSVWFLLVSGVGRGRRSKAKEPANREMGWEGIACIMCCYIPLANEGLSDLLRVFGNCIVFPQRKAACCKDSKCNSSQACLVCRIVISVQIIEGGEI